MAPTTIYVKPVLELLGRSEGGPIADPQSRPPAIHGMAHITGGGIRENIIRVVPDALGVAIDRSAWPLPPVFDWLQREGKVATDEMLRTFNCGIGYVLIVAQDDREAMLAELLARELPAWTIGEVVKAGGGERVKISHE